MVIYMSKNDSVVTSVDEPTRENIRDFLQRYNYNPNQVQRYKKIQRLISIIGLFIVLTGLFSIIIVFGFLISLTAHVIYPVITNIDFITPWYRIEEFDSLTREFITSVFFVSFYFGLKEVAKELKAYSEDTGIENDDDVACYYLALSINYYYEGNLPQAIKYLKKFDSENHSGLSFSSTHDISNYVERIEDMAVESDRREYLEETFEDVAGLIIQKIVRPLDENEKLFKAIVNVESPYYSNPTNSLTDSSSTTYIDIIGELITEKKSDVNTRFWVLFVIAAAIGLTIFIFVNNALSLIIITILFTAIQIHERKT